MTPLRSLLLRAAGMVVLLALGCGDATDPIAPRFLPARIDVQPTSARLKSLGESVQLEAVVYDGMGRPLADRTIGWASLDRGVAEVSDAGSVRSLRNGTARIVARLDSLADTTTVTVLQETSNVMLSPKTGLLEAIGSDLYLRAPALDANGNLIDAGLVSWVSLDPAVATASPALQTGLVPGARVLAKGQGTARIRVAIGERADTAVIVVRQVPARLSVAPDFVRLPVGAAVTLTAVLRDGLDVPIDTAVDLRWESSSSEVASVSSSGLVLGMSEGSATVTVYAGAFKARSTINVGPPSAAVTWRAVSGGGSGGEAWSSGFFRGHTCALSQEGVAYCWGPFPGVANTLASLVPVPVAGGHRFTAISSGDSHACAIDRQAAVWCWGSNEWGQLGDGTTTDRVTPVQLQGGLRFRAISSGLVHTCGITVEGESYCWGSDQFGELGEGAAPLASCGSFSDRPSPCSRTPVRLAGNPRFAQIAAGHNHTCALTIEGTAYCWGRNAYGELGIPGTRGITEPQPINSPLKFSAIAPAQWHTCALTHAGKAYCWGINSHGQLGDPGRPYESGDVSPVVGDRSFSSITAGGDHTCALQAEGTAYCWGWRGIGNGYSDSWVPTRVVGGHRWAQVEAGGTHTCGVTVAGRLYCWGANRAGQLGNGGAGDYFIEVPVQIAEPTDPPGTTVGQTVDSGLR